MNDDGSFNLLVGATDLGTGSDTVLAQIAAEVLGVAAGADHGVLLGHRSHPVRRGRLRLVDHLPLGEAVRRRALEVREQILEVAADMLGRPAAELACREGRVQATAARCSPGRRGRPPR